MTSEMIIDTDANTVFLSTVFENLAGYAITAIDNEGGIIAFNEGARTTYGYTPEEVIGRAKADILFTPEFIKSGSLHRIMAEMRSRLNESSFEARQVRKSGETFPSQILFSPCRNKGGEVIGFIQIAQDVTERQQSLDALRRSEMRFRNLIEMDADGIIIVDQNGEIRFANPAAQDLFHRRSAQLIGTPFGFPTVANETSIIHLVLPCKDECAVEMRTLHIEWEQAPAIMALLRNVTAQLRAEKELYELSLTDELTGLYNRRGFIALAEQQLKLARRLNQEATLVFVDVDGMKNINDTMGHEQGDVALVAASRVLKSAFRDSDIIARLGGDEFAVLMMNCHAKNAETAVNRLTNSVSAHNETSTTTWNLTLSVGAATWGLLEEPTLSNLLDVADKEMYRHKMSRKKAISEGGNAPTLP